MERLLSIRPPALTCATQEREEIDSMPQKSARRCRDCVLVTRQEGHENKHANRY